MRREKWTIEKVVTGARKLARCAFADSVPGQDVMARDDPAVLVRLEACRACPHHESLGPWSKCGECGCILNCKARLRSESCPIGVWAEEKSPISPGEG